VTKYTITTATEAIDALANISASDVAEYAEVAPVEATVFKQRIDWLRSIYAIEATRVAAGDKPTLEYAELNVCLGAWANIRDLLNRRREMR
jgi:hypothetical protein